MRPTQPPGRYAAALEYLYPRTTTIKFGLDTTRALLDALGNPQTRFATIHVGGTNGKGSVCALIAAALQRHGLRVGLYTSPHLVSFRERIRVNGAAISEIAVASWTDALRTVSDERGATFFELTTAMAFAHFAASHVDIAVVEVGLGGRLDSTNIVDPLVSAVTHIALDHQAYLGDTLEKIAIEKAGIAKPGVPFVIGETDPAIVEWLIAGGGATVGQHRFTPVIVPAGEAWTEPLEMVGEHQRRNAAIAAVVLDQLPDPLRPGRQTVVDAFATVAVQGRVERHGTWLFDVAHNPDGVNALIAALQAMSLPRPLHAVISILADKEWREMLTRIGSAVDAVWVTTTNSAGTRSWNIDDVRRWASVSGFERCHIEPTLTGALDAAALGAGSVLVTGSFHTVGDAMALRGIPTV